MPETLLNAPGTTAENDYPRRILEQLMLLRAAGAFAPAETAPGRNVWRWRFRAGGWPVDVDLDAVVLEIRVYHARDEVAMAPVPANVMRILLGKEEPPQPGEPIPAPEAILAELRRIVAHWKAHNARIFIQPPRKVGHPDAWNRA